MTTARSRLVQPTITKWYHTISRCVRKLHLFGKESEFNRKLWLRNRISKLSEIFAISVGSFSIMDNHLHIVIRLEVDEATKWTSEEVAGRWAQICPPRLPNRRLRTDIAEWIEEVAKDAE